MHVCQYFVPFIALVGQANIYACWYRNVSSRHAGRTEDTVCLIRKQTLENGAKQDSRILKRLMESLLSNTKAL